MAQLLQGGLAARVFTDAIAALPSSLSLRTGCLQALSDVSLAGSQGLEDSIWQGIAADFADSEQAWDLRAQHALVCGSASYSSVTVSPARLVMPLSESLTNTGLLGAGTHVSVYRLHAICGSACTCAGLDPQPAACTHLYGACALPDNKLRLACSARELLHHM